MNLEILVLSENKDLINLLKKNIKNGVKVVAPNERTNSHEIKAKADIARILVTNCDYECDFLKCATKFISLHRYDPTPFLILRRSLSRRASLGFYNLFMPADYCLSATQKTLIQKIQDSEINALSTSWAIHSLNPIYKVMVVEREIVGTPSKRINILSLSESLNLSEPWLSNRFKKICKIGLQSFIHKNVFCHSLSQIISTEESIKSIALGHGYSPHSFSRRFFTIFGILPSNVRKRIININISTVR